MFIRIWLPLLAAASVLSLASSAEALSCQRRIVARGDSQVRVQQLCGEPAAKNQRVVERSSAVVVPAGNGYLADSVSVSVLVERWTYDFGPRRSMQELTFEDGVLVNVRTRGYGTAAGMEAARRAGYKADGWSDRPKAPHSARVQSHARGSLLTESTRTR